MQQKMVQTVNAAQVMLSNIMEMPLPDFEEHVKNELDSNEALERNTGDEDASDLYDGVRDSLGDYSRRLEQRLFIGKRGGLQQLHHHRPSSRGHAAALQQRCPPRLCRTAIRQ